jgi:hypothetical protein
VARVEPPRGAPTGPALTLHIGAGKTGTSSIQKLLAVNRELLAERGYLYPLSPGRRRHVRLGLFAKPDDELVRAPAWQRMKATDPAAFRARVRRRLLEEVTSAGPSRVVVSDEGLWGSSDAALARLRELTDAVARDVRVLAYLRRQDDLLLSRYQQQVKVGETRRLREWASGEHRLVFDYRDRLDRWAHHFGERAVVVRPFASGRFRGGSLYADFLDAAGIDVDPADLTPVEVQNESLDAESVELLRLLNLHRIGTAGVLPRDIDNRELAKKLATATGPSTLALPAAEMQAFWERWVEPNRDVAQRFLAPEDADLLTRPPRADRPATEQRLDPERVDHFVALLDLPEGWHDPLRALAVREARG